ncbi:MAG: MMPL family transporter, partial [Thermoleophilaceae bacterium]
MFDRLARLADARGKTVVILAIAGAVVAGAMGGGVADRLDPFSAEDPDTESVMAADRLEDAGYREASVIVLVDGVRVESRDGRDRIAALSKEIGADPDVIEVASYNSARSRDFVSRDGDSTYLAVRLSPTDEKELHDVGERIATGLEDEPGVMVGGSAIAERQANEQVEHDLRTAELYAFPILFVLSLLFFRSLVAAALPLLVGGLTIVFTMSGLSIANELGGLSVFALNLVIGLGLGLAIDYSLFVVSRYREEIAKTGPGMEALRRTMATAGRTVFFSALTVAGAIASLLVFPQNFLFSMGVGGALTALIAAAVSLTVLPAVLALLGGRVNALAPAALRRRAEFDAKPDEH